MCSADPKATNGRHAYQSRTKRTDGAYPEQGYKTRNTCSEDRLRQGYRYRLHKANLPGKPDLVFAGRKKVIFVHGCFWHRHPEPTCPLARLPKSKLDFWVPKLEANRQRDEANVRELQQAGWEVLTIWECQLKNEKELKSRIREFLQ